MSADVSNALSFIHALTRQLLHVPDSSAHQILIAVLPPMKARAPACWTVRVSYADFTQMTQSEKLEEALNALVSSLTNAVSKQLEDGAKLLAQT